MKKMLKPVSILLSLVMIISLFTIVPVTASAAEGVSYVLRWWDNDELHEQAKTRTDYKKLTDYAQDENHTLTSGWYVANGNVQFRRLIINGDVHIIVPDGVTMKCRNIIVNYSQNTLNIYGQANNTGKLEVTDGRNDDAAIGSYEDTGCGKNGKSGTIRIYGGKVTAKGAAYGAGIGAGDSCLTSGDVHIYGGDFGSDSEVLGATEEYGWRPIVTVENDTVLQAENNQTYDFSLDARAEEYQYYLIRVFYSQGADFIQMSEFELKTEEENVALSGDGFTMPAYPVIVSATFEADTYTVTWQNEDSTELEKDENVPYGSTPEFDGTVPPKTDCTFMGWSDGEGVYAPEELPKVTKDVTYTAVFGSGDGLGSELVGHSISLDGDIAVNFYMQLSDYVIAHEETAYMHFAVPVENGTIEQKVYVRDAVKKEVNGKNYYVFKCRVAAKEMSSDIKAQLIDGSRAGREYTYSVKDYSNYLIKHENESAEYLRAVPLVKKMLNYGAYAQIYFDKNTANLANAILTDEEKALDNVTVTEPQTSVTLPKGVTFEDATLSLKSETSLSLYFTSETSLTFSAGDKTVETVSSGNYQIARIRGIAAKELQDSFELNITAGEAAGSAIYSPMNYCYKILNDGTYSENLINVTKALVLYAQAANTYFA